MQTPNYPLMNKPSGPSPYEAKADCAPKPYDSKPMTPYGGPQGCGPYQMPQQPKWGSYQQPPCYGPPKYQPYAPPQY